MNERRVVRTTGRPTYGRRQPSAPPKKRRWRVSGRVVGMLSRLVILAVVVVGVGWWVLHLFSITDIEVNTTVGQSSLIESTTQQLIAKSWTQSNLLTLNSGGLTAKLEQSLPGLRSVTLERKPPHTLVVSAVLKQPSLVWTTGGQTYVLDSNGTVIGAASASETASLLNVADASNLPVHTGEQVVSSHFVTFVRQLGPALSADGVKVTGYSISSTTFDLDVATKGYQLIFDTTRDVGSEMSDLKAVQATLAQQKATPTAYIDLRVPGKAYWK